MQTNLKEMKSAMGKLEDQLMEDFKKFIRKLNRRTEKSGDQKVGYRVELV